MFTKTTVSDPYPFFLPWTKESLPEMDARLNPSEDIQALRNYVESNPNAKDYVNLILYYLACSTENKFSNPELAKMLLEVGANPNYIHENDNSEGYKSVLEVAAELGKSWLVAMLLEKGANPVLYVKYKIPSGEKFAEVAREEAQRVANLSKTEQIIDMVQRGKLPIQVGFKNYQKRLRENPSSIREACALLAKRTIFALNLEPNLLKLFRKQYEILQAKIAKSFAEAKKKEQQFIIMVGEHHEGLSSLVIEQMVLLICKDLGIHTLLTEHNQYMEDTLNERGYIPTREREWLVSLTINKQSKSHGINIIPVDLGHFGAEKIGKNFNSYEYLTGPKWGFENSSLEGIKYRNEIIHNVIVEGIKNDSMLLVGASHLYGLREETPFPESIAVLSINAEKKKLQGGKVIKKICNSTV